MKKVLIILLFVFSCNQDKRETKVNMHNLETQLDSTLVYNHVLNGLIKNYLYNKHLGDKAMYLLVDYLFDKKIDSTTYSEKLNILKSKIEENDSLKGTLYVNDVFLGYEGDINFLKLPKDFDVDKILFQIKKENKLEVSLLSSSFVRLRKLSDKFQDSLKVFEVGELSLSKLTLNKDQNLGILYFSFICGSKCGEGSLILIEKKGTFWQIKEKYTIWEI